ncbi:FK506-binding protein 15 isoform X1 [Strigops habroptila]|uniref:FK506-binding protein 15 isoform X1 n=2 Tax=Strigops habroptila TaxID=2489341 RepID=UPI0011D01150|nr:FK506-binding protein 15 isoform X1 [Strigops habroptila]XP_030362890.1 FK506-binding protein 15 isoform X1 [Strigops habroptila]
MFGATEEDDADFLSPASGARLASLFGLDQTVSSHGNEFFQYTAPKQPKKSQTAAAGQAAQKAPVAPAASGDPSVFAATAVHAYRYTNGQYLKQGKYGAAVVGNHATKEYRLLLYISQQQQITTARIHPGFVLTVQPNNYSTFYDDQRQNWSIMFESEKAAMDFSKQVCIAKCNSSPVLDSVLSQDLLLGEGQGAEGGDSLEVAYTGWLFQNNGLGQVFDSNVNKDKLLRLKLGSGKVIKGWEEGMMGMKKGGRRYLIIPPAWAYGAQGVAGRVPPDSTLVFEVEVRRVKLVKECSGSDGQSVSSRDSPAPSPVPSSDGFSADTGLLPPFTVPPKPGEPAVRAKSNSISEQLANPDVAKAKLISRMAKMGQPMLPFLAGTAGSQLDSSDSEIEDPNTLRGTAQPVASSSMRPAQPAHAVLPTVSTQVPQASGSAPPVSSAALIPATIQPHSALPAGAQGFQAYPGMAFAYPQTAASASQLQPVGQMYPAPYQAPGDVTSFLMTEARQHNTEIRMAVSKVVDKMDHLAAKVEELRKQNAGNSSLLPGISSVTMEASMIMSNIQRIIQENERLKQEIFEKSSRIEEQNEKISELIERNQRYVEQSNLLMEQRNHSLQTTTENTQARVLHAEQEKAKVAEELAAATAQVSQLQLELTAHQKKEMDLRKQLSAALQEAERHETQLNKLQAQLAELQEASEDTQTRFKAEKQSRKQLDMKISALEEELTDLKVEKETLERNLAERKKKSLSERAQAEEEMEEIRRSYQQELDKLRQLLKKTRTSTDQAAAEQLSLIQAELESQWEAKCERTLASAKEQHMRQYQEVCEQRDSLQQQVSQLEEKLAALKHSKKAEEQKLSEFQQRLEQLEPIKEKCSALQSDIVALKAHYEERIRDLERDQAGSSPADFTEEVKKIMNGVFQSLRGEFELEETYSGRTVLGVVMNTIKTVTLQLLSRQQEKPDQDSEKEESGPGAVRQEESPGAKPDHEKLVHHSPAQSAMFPADPGEATTGSVVPGQEDESAPLSARPTDSEEEPVAHSSGVAEEEKIQGEHLSSAAESHLDLDKEPVLAGQPVPEGDEDFVPAEQRQESSPIRKAETERSPSKVSLQAEVAEPSVLEARPEVDVAELPGKPAVEQKAEEPVAGLEPPPLNGEGGNCTDPLDGATSEKEPPLASSTAELSSAVSRETPGQQELDSSPKQKDSSLFEDDNFFETASQKPLKPRVPSEEEDEEEVSMKGRPPPAPLFGDDDDDDLDWLG